MITLAASWPNTHTQSQHCGRVLARSKCTHTHTQGSSWAGTHTWWPKTLRLWDTDSLIWIRFLIATSPDKTLSLSHSHCQLVQWCLGDEDKDFSCTNSQRMDTQINPSDTSSTSVPCWSSYKQTRCFSVVFLFILLIDNCLIVCRY